MTEPEVAERRWPDAIRLAILAVAVIAGAILWLAPLRTSLSLDETGTYWVIRDGIRETIRRAVDVQGQSPLYYIVEFVALRVLGASELALRVPSVVASFAGTFFLYRLGRRLLDSDAAVVAVAAFVVWPAVSFHAADARPYAFAMAIAIGATLALVRFAREPTTPNAALYAITAALVVYAHYLFALVLLAHVVYLAACARRGTPRPKPAAAAVVAIGVLCLPLLPQLASLARRSEALSWTGDPQLSDLALVLAAPALIAALGIVLRRMFSNGEPLDPPAAYLLAGWALVPPLVTFVVSTVTSAKTFDPRYFVVMVGAQALLVGWAIGRMPARSGKAIVAVALALAVVAQSEGTHAADRWKEAIAVVNQLAPDSRTPVLVHSGFVETRDVDVVAQADERDFVLAPVGYYDVKGTVLALPFNLEGDRRGYVDALISSATVRDAQRFVVVTNFIDVFQPRMAERLARAGFRRKHVGDFGQVRVTLFER